MHGWSLRSRQKIYIGNMLKNSKHQAPVATETSLVPAIEARRTLAPPWGSRTSDTSPAPREVKTQLPTKTKGTQRIIPVDGCEIHFVPPKNAMISFPCLDFHVVFWFFVFSFRKGHVCIPQATLGTLACNISDRIPSPGNIANE